MSEIKPKIVKGEPYCFGTPCPRECKTYFPGDPCALALRQQRDEYKAMFDKTVDFLMETEKTLSIQSTREQWTEFFRRKAAQRINGYLEGAERKEE